VVVGTAAMGTAAMGAAVIMLGAAVVITGAAVVRGSTGGSVKPVTMSSTASTSGLVVVITGTAGTAVVEITATGCTVVGASVGDRVVGMTSTCWGGAAKAPAASNRGTKKFCLMVGLL